MTTQIGKAILFLIVRLYKSFKHMEAYDTATGYAS
jgi:hypothetical protein